MLKRILVPLDSSEFTPATVQLAAEMALAGQKKSEEAVTIVGLAVVDTDQLPTGRFASLVPREKLLKEAEKQARELAGAFRSLAAARGMPDKRIEASWVAGSPFREIIRHGVFSDIIVMNRECSFPPANQAYDTLNNLYHWASRPVVICGDTHRPVKRVVMAMDGTAPASRMMYAYAHLNPFPKAKLKVVYSEEEESAYNLKKFFKNVQAYLKTYHLNAELVGISGDFQTALSEVVQEEKAGMLAMGIPVEHFMDKFRERLSFQEYPVQKLVRDTGASLFTVH
jgi:nucleotide-binding universal stress UspA family protein